MRSFETVRWVSWQGVFAEEMSGDYLFVRTAEEAPASLHASVAAFGDAGSRRMGEPRPNEEVRYERAEIERGGRTIVIEWFDRQSTSTGPADAEALRPYHELFDALAALEPETLPYRCPHGEVVTPAFLWPLRTVTAPFPHEVIEDLRPRAHLAAPTARVLRGIIEDFGEFPPDYMLPSFAMALLGHWARPETAETVIDFLSLPAEEVDALLGDFLTEEADWVLSRVVREDPWSLRRLIENREADAFARVAALDAHRRLLHEGVISRAELSEYVGWLLREGLEREDSPVWIALAYLCADEALVEHHALIERALSEKLLGLREIDLAYFRECLGFGEPTVPPWEKVETDIFARLARWHCFTDGWTRGKWAEEDVEPRESFELVEPYVREAPKVGRNDPCPCGSGRKFKKCCGAAG